MWFLVLLASVLLGGCGADSSPVKGFEALAALSNQGHHGPHDVTFTWDPVEDPSVKGYRLHLGITPGVYIGRGDVGNLSSYTLRLPAGYTWYVAVSAYNAAGEGPLSREVTVAAP